MNYSQDLTGTRMSNYSPLPSHYQLAVDLESELRGLTRINSRCPENKYKPTYNCPNKNCYGGFGKPTDCISCLKLNVKK